MANYEPNKRRESRLKFQGVFDRTFFILGSLTVLAEPIDISPSGLGLLIEAAWKHDDIATLRLIFLDDEPPLTLNMRFKVQENTSGGFHVRTRCGLELSPADKDRGINLIELLGSRNHNLHLPAV